MLTFFVTVHVLPPATAAGPQVVVGYQTLSTLSVDRERLQDTIFACSFEQSYTRLAALERMYCEPDGSFVWVSSQGEPAWQVDGNLYDRNERLLFVDLKGTCPSEQFDRLLSALGWPGTPLMFQLTRDAIFLDEAQFRRYATPGPPEAA